MSKAAKRKAKSKNGLMPIEIDPGHHLTGPFLPQTPFGTPPTATTPVTGKGSLWSKPSPVKKDDGFLSDIVTGKWVVNPASSFKLALIPVILYFQWELITPYIDAHLNNPFKTLLFISGRVPGSPDSDPRYQKTYLDFVFMAYYVVVFSWFRQFITITVTKPVTKYWGIRKEAKIKRFGEQAHAFAYFTMSGLMGIYVMSLLPTWWYKTDEFWKGYPHWDMIPQVKQYYLVQASYWLQQLLVMVLRLEKPRKDYYELICHHIVTLWLIGWSYLINLTMIGVCVYASMDIPDAFLALSKMFNYMQLERTKTISFVIFIFVWTYFRHWLNLVMLWSVWFEFDLVPKWAQQWAPPTGAWLVPWMRYQIFAPILALQFLNLFWYFFILRIAYRALGDSPTDDRSDDEDDEKDSNKKKNK